MAVVMVNVSCGCGYKTSRPGAAEEHSDRTKHKMTIAGTVTPTTEATQVASTSARSTIDEIRAKLNGGG